MSDRIRACVSEQLRDTYKIVDIWVGRWPDEETFHAFFEEVEEYSEGEPISPFAASQKEWFYDHDFVEREFHPLSDELEPVLLGHSGYPSWSAAVRRKCKRRKLGALNGTVLAFGMQFDTPRTFRGGGVELHYLGRFPCEISSPRLDDGVTDRPPAKLRLESLDGLAPSFEVDARGVTLGTGGSCSERPYVDLARPELAPVQAIIYQDQWEQWLLEDKADNGQTKSGDRPISKMFPGHAQVFRFGEAAFRWTCLF